jgi:predicted metalloprotease with PDZ domain
VAQLVGYDALIIPAWRASTPVEATFVFRNLAPDAPIATSFGARRTVRDSVLVAQTQLGNLLHALYSFGVRPGARAYDRVLEGGPVMVLIRGHLTIPDSVLVDGVQRVIAAERAFWGTRPPSDYTISIGVAPRGSLAGMRVTNAFVADIDSTRTMDSDVIMLFAHELMHEWIGGMLHSASAVRDGELGWFTEGFTDYETKRVLRASHIITDSAYVALVNRSLADHAVSTASDSSWDAIVKGFWRDGAMQREPYLRGELLAIRLDAAIRTATNDRRSLDALLQELVRDRDLAAAGLTESLFASRVQREVGDLPVAREIASALAGGAITLPDGALGACAQPRMQQRARWDPGFDVDGSLRAGSMTAVRPGGPADKAGLREGMKIGRASISRGDATRKLELGVKTDTGLVTYGYLPAGATVRVQQFVPRSSCQ